MGDLAKYFLLTALLAGSMLLSDAGPCFSRTGAPAPVMVLAVAPTKHVIKAGDTLNALAMRYGVPAAAILRANPGLDASRLQLGKAIVIPPRGPAAQAPAAAAPAAGAEPPDRMIVTPNSAATSLANGVTMAPAGTWRTPLDAACCTSAAVMTILAIVHHFRT